MKDYHLLTKSFVTNIQSPRQRIIYKTITNFKFEFINNIFNLFLYNSIQNNFISIKKYYYKEFLFKRLIVF